MSESSMMREIFKRKYEEYQEIISCDEFKKSREDSDEVFQRVTSLYIELESMAASLLSDMTKYLINVEMIPQSDLAFPYAATRFINDHCLPYGMFEIEKNAEGNWEVTTIDLG